MRLHLLLVGFIFFIVPSLFSQSNQFRYSVNQDSFPKVIVDFNLRNPVVKTKKDFTLEEGGKDIDFSFVSTGVKSDSTANKNILILVENLKQRDRLEFYKKVLNNALPFIVEEGDKFNIAVFDRVREKGAKTIFSQLDEYTDDKEQLKEAIKNIQPRDDIFSNNKSSDVYHAIYDGLHNLNDNFKENRHLFVLSSAFNNKWSGHNSPESSKLFAVEHNIPIYSIQYLIPGGEAHILSTLVEGTYGDQTISKDANGSAVALSNYMDNAYKKGLGQNYSIGYTSTFPSDGKEYKSQFLVEGKTYEIEIQTPQPSLWHTLWNKYRYYTISGLLLFLLLLIFIIRSISRTNKKDKEEKAQLASAINTAQGERDKAQELIYHQNRELQEIKRENKKKEQLAKKKQVDEQLLQEMKKAGALPILDYSIGGQNRKYKMEKPLIKIGRADDNDIIVKNNTVSRNHTEIYFSGGQYFIRDIDSTAGTVLNGRKVKGEMVKHNDVIQLGGISITFIR